MRGLTSTLLAKQKIYPMKDNLCKIVLTGANTYTYKLARGDRVLDIKHTEEPYKQVAEVLLDNADGTLTDLDFKGYKGVISGGYTTSGGDEYSDPAPLWVIGQQNVSLPGRLATSLSLAGTFNLMNEDRASEAYIPSSTNTDTVKTILQAIAGATLACYSHCVAYTIAFDSEDSLIDTFIPKDSFRINLNETRTSKMKELIRYTGCVTRVENSDDGNDNAEIHISVPAISTSTAWEANTPYVVGDTVIPTVANEVEYKCTTAGTSGATEPTDPTPWPTEVAETVTDGGVVWTVSYNYDYRLESTYHTFFSKSHRKRLVLPNYIVVKTRRDDAAIYSGSAEDTASSDLIEKRYYKELPITTDAQGTSIATAILGHYQIDAERGAGVVPMNVGTEVYDFVKVKDTRQVDYRVGNIGSITRHYAPGIFQMSFRFGSVELGGLASTYSTYLTEVMGEKGGKLDFPDVMPLFVEILSIINNIVSTIEWLKDQTFDILEGVIEKLHIMDSLKLPVEKAFYADIDDACVWVVNLDPASYTATHDRAIATGYSISSKHGFLCGQMYNPYPNYAVYRFEVRFDTSSLPDDAIIIGATLSFYGESDYSDTDFNVTVVDGSTLFIDPLTHDYGNMLNLTTSLGSLSTSGWNITGYNDIELNSLAFPLISKIGWTQFGIRSSRDISATEPTGDEEVVAYRADQGGGYMPKLTVKYTTDLSDEIDRLEDDASTLAFIGF